MKKTCIVFFLIISHVLSSQSEAESLLNNVSVKVESYDNIAISFKYVLINIEEDINQETRGEVTMQGDKYVLNIMDITRMFDGSTLYSISPEDEEVTISSENSEDDSTITPSKMLSFYKEGYTFEMDIVQTIKGRKIQYIKMNPIDSDSEINHLLLGIDTKTYHIHNLIEIGSNKTKTILTVNSFKTNQELSKSLFTFDYKKYNEYYINKID
ncbi:outer membrane lipoprotein carrier protein LolA [Flavobacteriaceae bacterium]|nr:outer membrane lipoprotein carrier protein LolA [Flavobacteriaceae bacterium]